LLLLTLGVTSSRAWAATSPATPLIDGGERSYDVVYVRQPRKGDDEHIIWPEVFHPARVEPGSDLMLLHPDGSEEVLVAAGPGAVTDPSVAFDGEWIYYSYFYDVRPEALNYQRGYLPNLGADIFRIHVTTRQVEQLTHGEFTPNSGAGHWDETNPLDPTNEYNRLGYGILNLAPAPLAGDKIVFVSNRNGFVPTKSFTSPTLQLYVMDRDGSNVTPIAPMTLGSALHPTPLADGRILFSSYESQGLRDQRLWGLWSIWPDGRYWAPVVSAFKGESAFHFATQLSSGDLVVEDYYNLNNFGFGTLYRLPAEPPAGMPAFYSAFPADNPPITQTIGSGLVYPFRMGFTPRGMSAVTPFTHGSDEAAPLAEGGSTEWDRVGKVTHPSAAPDNDLLVAYSAGPVNALNRPTNLPAPDAGIYLIRNGGPAQSPTDLMLIKNDPAYNEVWPRAVVAYAAIHGVDEPVALPWLPNDGAEHSALPAGTPYGLVGTSSFYKRESFPGIVRSWANTFDGLDAFNTTENGQSSNWVTQGADAGKYVDGDIWAVRLLAMEPNSHRSYGPNSGQHFFNHVNEKLRILGEIPLRKFDQDDNPILDTEGNPDTSFLAKIPADTPFTFQLLDRNGMVLTAAQTWHQVRPGEVRTDCGGCHAHSQQPLAFAGTAASQADYAVWDLVQETPLLTADSAGEPALRREAGSVVNVEFYRDIRPLLQRSCVQCHTQTVAEPPGKLVLDDLALVSGPQFSGLQFPGDYARLCFDAGAQWGYPPLVTVGGKPVWRQTNASRYIRPFQSRRSLLIWKIFGARLDGWTNADHPTESVPGDATTLPVGAIINEADLDYTGTIMPPPDSDVPPLTVDEQMRFARWVDLGCPINEDEGGASAAFGWYLDDVRPTVALSSPRAGRNENAVAEIHIGLADAYTGVDLATLSITATVAINNRPAGTKLADLVTQSGDGIYTIALSTPLTLVTDAHLYVQVADHQGNVTRVDRRFAVAAAGTPTPSPTPPILDDGAAQVFLPVVTR